MIIPDANLLIYAHGTDNEFHTESKAWWQNCLSGNDPIGLTHAATFAFVRLITNRRLFPNALSIDEAVGHVEFWLDQSIVQLLPCNAEDARVTLNLLIDSGTGGNLTTGAQIAALALHHRGVVHTADSDFARFPGVRWHNPLARRRS